MDYFDDDQGVTRLCFRYVLSLHESPKLHTGYSYETTRSERIIRLDQFPLQVIKAARGWLTTNADIARAQGNGPLADILTEHLKLLQRAEPPA